MTNHTNLIARLRKDDLFWKAPITCRSEAADAIEAAQTEIEREKECTALAVTQAEKLIQQRNAALARLAELTKQEPVMVYDGRCIWDCGDGGHQDVTMLKMIAKGTKLYAAAGASPVQPVQGLQSVADALTIEQLNDKVERLMAVQPSQAGGVSKQDIYDIAHRKATRYVCTAAPSDVMYGFSEMHLLDFVAAINAKESGK